MFEVFACFLLFVSGISCSDLGSFVEVGAASRHLLATDGVADSGVVFENNCSMLYTRGVDIKHIAKSGEETTIVLPGANTSYSVTGNCTNTIPGHSVMNVEYKAFVSPIDKFSMKMTFNSTASGAWSMTEMLVTIRCLKGTESNCSSLTDAKMDVSFITSYLGFSYHCYKPHLIKSGNSTMGIYFNKLQVQGFDVKDKRFSSADDCIGFFTGGVWSSLFVALILTIILLYGVGMISSINSMDRFDDPRGPGIQINISE